MEDMSENKLIFDLFVRQKLKISKKSRNSDSCLNNFTKKLKIVILK